MGKSTQQHQPHVLFFTFWITYTLLPFSMGNIICHIIYYNIYYTLRFHSGEDVDVRLLGSDSVILWVFTNISEERTTSIFRVHSSETFVSTYKMTVLTNQKATIYNFFVACIFEKNKPCSMCIFWIHPFSPLLFFL